MPFLQDPTPAKKPKGEETGWERPDQDWVQLPVLGRQRVTWDWLRSSKTQQNQKLKFGFLKTAG